MLHGWAATLFSDAMGTDDQQTPVRYVRNLPLPFALSLDSVLESMLASAMWARLGSWVVGLGCRSNPHTADLS